MAKSVPSSPHNKLRLGLILVEGWFWQCQCHIIMSWWYNIIWYCTIAYHLMIWYFCYYNHIKWHNNDMTSFYSVIQFSMLFIKWWYCVILYLMIWYDTIYFHLLQYNTKQRISYHMNQYHIMQYHILYDVVLYDFIDYHIL